MTVDDLLSRLGNVRQRGARWSACCPAHDDRSPSLSISEGDRGVLLRCWAGCSVAEICATLAITVSDLFFDAQDADPQRRKAAIQQRDIQRQARERHEQQQGALIDALREADAFIESRRRFDTSKWSHDRWDNEMNALADAYHLLESEALDG